MVLARAGEIAVIASPLDCCKLYQDDAVMDSAPAHGDVTVNADGSFTYIPDFKYVGPDSFDYSAGGETCNCKFDPWRSK